MQIEEMRERIAEEFNPDYCVACPPVELVLRLGMDVSPITLIDVMDIRWCAEHQFRGEFVNLMKQRGWPALVAHPYEIAAGAWFTVQIALTGNDEAVALLGMSALEGEEKRGAA